MKRLKQHWSTRPISYLLSLCIMVMPVLMLILGSPTPAKAQDVVLNAQPRWASLDFSNHSGYGGDELGRQASDAFVLELGKSNKYDLVPRKETLASVDNLGLTLPLDNIGLIKLSRDLEADGVITGEVAAVSFSDSPRRATVSVIVRVTDAVSGELVNGAIAEGTSTPRPAGEIDDDSMVNQAIDNAAFAAVRQITAFNLPVATILTNEDPHTVMLNGGTRSGLYDGLTMIVTRNNEEVGRVRVGHVSTDESDASITEDLIGIDPGDRCTAVYSLPSYSVVNNRVVTNQSFITAEGAPTAAGGGPKFSGVTGMLLAVLVGAVLLGMVKHGGEFGTGTSGASARLARIDNDPNNSVTDNGQLSVVLRFAGGITGFPAGGPPLDSSLTFTPTTTTPTFAWVNVGVEIKAGPGSIDPTSVYEYNIYRPDYQIGFAGIGVVPIFAQPGDANAGYLDYLVDDGNNRPEFGAELLNEAQTAVSPYTCVGGGTGENDSQFCAGTFMPTRIIGSRFAYQVNLLYLDKEQGGTVAQGTPHLDGYPAIQTPSSSTNTITYMQPPALEQTCLTQNPSTEPCFYSLGNSGGWELSANATLGGNDYIMQVSTDPGFQTGVYTFVPAAPSNEIQSSFALTAAGPRAGPSFQFFPLTPPNTTSPSCYSTSGTIQASTAFNPVQVCTGKTLWQQGVPIFVRIGARDRNNGSSTTANPYLFSDPVEPQF